MRVTLDIPEGYEAKIVASHNPGKVIFEFTMGADRRVADVIFETVKTLFGRLGWSEFFMHTNACTDGRTLYRIMAEAK